MPISPHSSAGCSATEIGLGELESTTRQTHGLAVGFSLIIVGFEFEWSQTGGDDLGEGECVVIGDVRGVCAPALATGMGNVLLQTPRGLLPRAAVRHGRCGRLPRAV